MSKPIFQDLFKFSGRRNRQSYILLMLTQVVALFAMFVMIGAAIALMDSTAAPIGYMLLLASFVLFVGIAVSGWASGSQRIRDFGQSGVWILLTLVPYIGWLVSLAIMFVPSDPGENRYGPSCI